MPFWVQMHSDVSEDTKRTSRNLLVAGATSMFAIWSDAKIHKLAVFNGAIDREAYAHVALLVILGFFIVAHFLNLESDLARDMEGRSDNVLDQSRTLVEEDRHNDFRGREEDVLETAKKIAKDKGVDHELAKRHYS